MSQSTTEATAAVASGPSVLIDRAVQLLGVSKRTVYYWIRSGRLQTVRTRCGSQRVFLSSIAELLEAQARARAARRAARPNAFGAVTS